jgi:hypothetical protein
LQSEATTDPNEHKMDFVLEAGETMMKTLEVRLAAGGGAVTIMYKTLLV